MLADRATQLDAEEESSGHPSVWRDVHALFRCPGPPCDLGPYCWRDPISKKRYKLRTSHLKALIDFAEQGDTLQSHDDVPEYIREQLVAEEQQRLERLPNAPANAATPLPPINITNVLPSSHQPSIAGSVKGWKAEKVLMLIVADRHSGVAASGFDFASKEDSCTIPAIMA